MLVWVYCPTCSTVTLALEMNKKLHMPSCNKNIAVYNLSIPYSVIAKRVARISCLLFPLSVDRVTRLVYPQLPLFVAEIKGFILAQRASS